MSIEEFMRQMNTLKQVHDVWAQVIVFDEEDENIQQLCTKTNQCKILYAYMYVCIKVMKARFATLPTCICDTCSFLFML